MTLTSLQRPPAAKSEPAWDIARLYPDQGYWTEGDYLDLNTNHLVEFTDGFVEVLPMPTQSHQLIAHYLGSLLKAAVTPTRTGRVLMAPFRIRLAEKLFREPDVALMLAEHFDRTGEKFWYCADLVMEIVSEDSESHQRDWVQKRADYAKAGIPEYWIVDPQQKTVSVFKLVAGQYESQGEFRPGQRAASVLVEGFSVEVTDVLTAGGEIESC